MGNEQYKINAEAKFAAFLEKIEKKTGPMAPPTALEIELELHGQLTRQLEALLKAPLSPALVAIRAIHYGDLLDALRKTQRTIMRRLDDV